MNIKSAAPAQAQTQDVVAAAIWNPMSPAPAGDNTACMPSPAKPDFDSAGA